METPVSVGESLIHELEIDRLQKSMEVGHSNEPDYMKFVCDLSTLLVATIQEAKDRISQVEYIFCSQLYPTFQKNSKSLQKIYMEARKAAEEECREMNRKMVDQVNELYLEKQQNLVDKENMIRKISELEVKLSSRDMEIEKGKKLHYTLQKAMESKCSDADSKQKLLTQYEERLSSLFSNTRELEEERCQLKEEIGKKNEALIKQGRKLLSLEELLESNESERETLELKLKNVESCINDLRVRFETKTIEVKESRKLQEQLVQKIDVKVSELERKEQLLSVHEQEKALLLSRLKDLENRNEKCECCKQLGQKIESKQSELLTEKQKRKDLVIAYKSLKSQYNFLCKRSGLIEEKREVENDPHSHNAADKNMTSVSNIARIETTDSKGNRSSGSSEEQRNPSSDSKSPSKWQTSRKSGGDWRATRSREDPKGHEDFLDTPLENIRENLAKALVSREEDEKEEEEEEVVLQKEQPQQGLKRTPKAFKYVEPVRKKAQREALKGIECKQCKKFYDAVIPDGEGSNKNGFRCEHLDAVSRHRYRYAPPMTPEGFWNIGFDSEI